MSMRTASRKPKLMQYAAAAALLAGTAFLAAPAQAADTAPAADNAQVSEVIVTATRREERLSKVPIAVTAITGEQAKTERVTNFVDIPAMVPGATFVSTKGQSTANLQVRGQTTTNDSPHLELPVAIFADDIYYGTLASFDADFFDVQQIAILRGPQGTTFGRNVVGGALQITSNKPTLGDGAYGEVNATLSTYGRHDQSGFETQGFVNLPISESVAARLAYSVKNNDGYMFNRTTGHNVSDQQSYAIRSTLLWQVNEDLRLTALVQFNHENMYASGYQSFGQGSLVNSLGGVQKPWEISHDVDGQTRRDIVATQLRADWEQPIGTITSLTSYRTLDSLYEDDGDSSPLALNRPSINRSNEWQFSQELRLTSPAGRKLEYITGVYYSFENLKKAITFGFNGTIPQSRLSIFTAGQRQDAVVVGDNHVLSIAPYAELKYHITDQLAFTAGGRYTYEKKKGYTNHTARTWAYGAPFDVQFEKSWKKFTPRAILEFTPMDGALIYGSVSTGFKGGGWSLTSTTPLAAVTPLEPENSTSYEVGTKLRLLDNRLVFNLAAYRAKTKNVQVRTLVNGVLNDTNAGGILVKGVEVETVASPIENLQIGINYAYTDATYSSFRGCTATGVDCSGNPVPFTPKNDLKIYVNYELDLGEMGTLNLHADDQWASSFQVSPLRAQPIGVRHTARKDFINLSATYTPAEGSWKLQVWARNVLNRWSMPAPANYGFYFLTPQENAALEVDRGVINPPRQIGMTFTYRFE
ncbi:MULTISPECIES: TonB-dependent receptor [unclassified Phenylobacterium]|uniref:TonB-dependent receptor n=1 Tax=unclassified Phenylobacterium TaxID=2640670 RepID=UPI0009E8C0B9|nr:MULTISPECIES: TonB-dependent receptor [unclassified Phenylobacterium]